MSADDTLDGADAARLIKALHDLDVPDRAKDLAAADAKRVNDGVKRLADTHLDFFDAPQHVLRAQRELKR